MISLCAESTLKWISVDDRLPEEGDYQVCIHRVGDSNGTRYTRFASVYSKAMVGGCSWEIEYSGKWKVTHWQPLPEPPHA